MSAYAADTWGIPSQTFLQWYLLAGAVAVGLSLYSRILARRTPSAVDTVRPPLTPPEVGALTSDYQAILASMAILRSAELITTDGKTKLALSPEDKNRLDWFTRTVHKRLGNGKVPLRQVRLMGRLNIALAQLRTSLIDAGYLQRPQRGLGAALRIVPIVVVIVIGVVRLIAGITGGKPVGYLFTAIIVLAVLIPFLRRNSRRTALGDVELRRMKRENSYLSPKLRPSFTSYGPSLAGLSAALFGSGALVLIDPALAGALSTGAAYGPGGGGSGSSFNSCGSSSGSDNSSSSSCGGGGCGG
ncbi:TIGR04222 domain-containing membrane protein [Rhodococcus sp. IEGM 1379]|uniref:TIGR04222 domain-containing membrane protein n=1 Tax=Rhodococcus sp. IEGM 1379 TaxID=3047086 RepID=UPI0024B64D70|nr:TIGR04222 domain-containing membrane protein [Rhodococcus sp. IEGM 1379]MDI9915971.1 TIGR04222 domain-containing membrane protein [Rhodococcus sp. IEGM 1379]